MLELGIFFLVGFAVSAVVANILYDVWEWFNK
jgi:hypothetical protein